MTVSQTKKQMEQLDIMKSLIVLLLISLLTVGAAHSAEQVIFYHTDPVGTPLAMTDASGNVVWQADYRPFGEEQSVTGSSANDRRFVGKEKDEETGLSYFGARYEDAKTGRFASVDPVGAVDDKSGKVNEKLLLEPQRLNVYAYGLNNPYRFVDEDGKWAQYVIAPIIYVLLAPSSTNAPNRNTPIVQSQSASEFASGIILAETGGFVVTRILGPAIFKSGLSFVEQSGILRAAAQGKGNFGIGSAAFEEAMALGKAWVGEGYSVSSSGKALVSADKLRIFRPPSLKPNSPYATTGMQANFEQKLIPGGRPISNAHLDVK